jgi:hypothetical protein
MKYGPWRDQGRLSGNHPEDGQDIENAIVLPHKI